MMAVPDYLTRTKLYIDSQPSVSLVVTYSFSMFDCLAYMYIVL